MVKLRLNLSGLSRAGSFSSAKSTCLKDGMNENMLTKGAKGRSRRQLIPPPFRRRKKQPAVVTESHSVPFVPLFQEIAANLSLDRAAPDDRATTVLSACGASILPSNSDAQEKMRLRAEVDSLKKKVTYLNDELDYVLASKEEM